MERFVERLLFASRWLLVPIYLGLAFAQLALLIKFGKSLPKVFERALFGEPAELILAVLELIDVALVAGLVAMVVIGGYQSFVSMIETDSGSHRPEIFDKLDPGKLKVKVASAIVGISGIHVLKVFMTADLVPTEQVWTLAGVHLVFVLTAVLMAVTDRIAHKAPPDEPH